MGRFENQVVFVPLTAPGDVVSVKIVELKKNFARGSLDKILEPSPSRVSPPCKYFEVCGGCSWQHISYDEQLLQKQKMIEDYLRRHLPGESPKIDKIVPSPNDFHYRNRIRLRHKGGRLGYYKRRTHELVAVDKCLIAEESINDLIHKIQSSHLASSVQAVQLFSNGKFVIVDETADEEGLVDSAFSQVNTAQNTNLINFVLQWIGSEKPKTVYDLYCGSGNLTFPIREKFGGAHIHAVELNSEAVSHAQQTAKARGFQSQTIHFYHADVGMFLKRHVIADFSTVVLDPPRAGCSPEVIRAIAFSKFEKLIYVSCDYTSFLRDYKLICQIRSENGLPPRQLKQLQPLDMFPQTDHVETVALIV